MLRRRRSTLVLLLLLAVCAVVAVAADRMNVHCKRAILRPVPDVFATRSLGEIHYGDSVTVVKKAKDWIQVTSSEGKTGWVHVSALTKKKVKASGDAKAAGKGFSGDEMAGSISGFSPEAEAGFKKNNPNISFDVVDKMEKNKVSMPEIVEFMKAGQVEGPKGGSK